MTSKQKSEDTELISFVKEVKLGGYYDLNYEKIQKKLNVYKKYLKVLGEYLKILCKYCKTIFQVIVLKIKVFLYKQWITFSKFCYSIDFNKKE